MTTRKRTTAIALTGAVALASGAYALGSQSGDGTAGATDPPNRPSIDFRGPMRGGPFGLDRIADRLGVEESELRDALRDLRPDSIKPPRPTDFAEELARELGVDQDEVEAALERIRERTEREMEQRHEEFAERLADRLGVDVDAIEDAFGDFPPFFFGWRHP
jgi:predicted transcriptional regulator